MNGFKLGERGAHVTTRPEDVDEVLQNVMAKIEKRPEFIRLALIEVIKEDARHPIHYLLLALHSVSSKALIAAGFLFFIPANDEQLLYYRCNHKSTIKYVVMLYEIKT
jgi:hypothetical protein